VDILLGLALSYHVGFEAVYNSVHPHVRLQHDHFITGLYYNSENSMSAYAGINLDLDNFFVEGGAVTGYSEGNVIPFARLGYKLGDMSFFVAPGIETYQGSSQIRPVIGLEILSKTF
jgi:hypothetical protein